MIGEAGSADYRRVVTTMRKKKSKSLSTCSVGDDVRSVSRSELFRIWNNRKRQKGDLYVDKEDMQQKLNTTLVVGKAKKKKKGSQ